MPLAHTHPGSPHGAALVQRRQRGAASREAGRVRATWNVGPGEDGPRLRLRWAESGGPAVTPPDRMGLRLCMVERGLRHGVAVSAKLSFAASGLICDLTLPLRQTRCGP